MPPLSVEERLSTEELSFFKEYGYLRKTAVLDPGLLARARDAMWQSIPEGPLRRSDPASWRGPFVNDEHPGQDLSGSSWFPFAGRTGGAQDLRTELVANNRLVAGWARQMLGEVDGAAGYRNRGIICRLPDGAQPLRAGVTPNTDDGRGHERCHNDGHGFHLGVIGLLDEVPMGGGATHIWPASHRRVYHLYSQQCMNARLTPSGHAITGQQAYSGEPGLAAENTAFGAEMRALNADTEPLDTHDTGSVNRSDKIRQACFLDFCHKNLQTAGLQPPPRDMWRDWSEELRKTPRGGWSLALAEEQRLVGRLVGGVRVTADNATMPLVEEVLGPGVAKM